MTDMPLPRQSSNSSRMRSSTGRGSGPGPALKLKTRFVVFGEAVRELKVTHSFRVAYWRSRAGSAARIASQNSRNLSLDSGAARRSCILEFAACRSKRFSPIQNSQNETIFCSAHSRRRELCAQIVIISSFSKHPTKRESSAVSGSN